MPNSTKKILREEYQRLKNAVEKILKPTKNHPQPQLILQPISDKKYLRGTNLS